MNLELAKSVVDAIACPCREHANALHRFRGRDWRRSYHWLISSGLALHLFAALQDCQADASLPPDAGGRLLALDRASAVRTKELRRDLLELNRRFESLGARYANWKGFALEPDFCVDVRLRPQMDFDFVVQPKDAELFHAALRAVGYQPTRLSEIEATYEIMPGQPYSLEQVYEPKPHRKVELHFAADHASGVTPAMDLTGALKRHRTVMMGNESIPVLAPEDAFLSHAAHAGRHALEGWVRLGWLHEIDRFARYHDTDTELWNNVRCLAEQSGDLVTSAAVAILLTARVWRRKLPGSLGWAKGALPLGAVHWIEFYGPRLAMADFPGTKLNLLLQRELIGTSKWHEVERQALYRRRAIPHIAYVHPGATVAQRIRAANRQSRFTFRRIVFHCVETIRYYFLKWQSGRPGLARKPATCNVPAAGHSNSFDGRPNRK